VYEIQGIVQGVGFRPAVYNLAANSSLGGSIKNSSGKVKLSLVGTEASIDAFIAELPRRIPVQARIDSITLLSSESCSEKSNFMIFESDSDESYKVSIPADLAICEDCRREINDPSNRRYQYPFTTCVNCGPRYTVVNAMPYDRCRTTLSSFPLCDDCLKEYTNPSDRRFHAESIACPKCGPTLSLHDQDGIKMDVGDCLAEFKKLIRNGRIVAVRGIGGFLIAVDAKNIEAITLLRDKKQRPHKPFALMARDIQVIRKYCDVSDQEESLLKSPSAPVVILKRGNRPSDIFIDLISPDSDTIGFMLPYSPLHELLFDNDIDLLVMTSANKRGEPICISNDEAFERLKGIVDAYLCHDREINLRNDDSLSVMQHGKPQVWRRGRGFAPDAIYINHRASKTILAMGAELKNTIALAFDNEVVISPHIGDLETIEANESLTHLSKAIPEFYRKDIQIIARDLHPDMHSSIIGSRIAFEKGIPIIEVQHHHAHAVSCMAEHGFDEAIAVVFDGTGLGTDGNIWGAEVLYVNKDRFERMATFSPVRLPGGDAAVYQPIRQLIARYIDAGVEISKELCDCLGVTDEERKIWKMQCLKGLNSPFTHAAGRLFDSISVMLGICENSITYEGQGAIRLESEALRFRNTGKEPSGLIKYSMILKDSLLSIDWSETFRNFSPDRLLKLYADKNYLSLRKQYAYEFHHVLSYAVSDMVSHAVTKKHIKTVVLSGGVFMNRLLTSLVIDRLSKMGFDVFINEKVPSNDGGISFGQAVIASYFR
ncbi:MAG: carbamoyltransferase HypF, partial [Lentisphaerota bacterium]